MKIRLVRLIPTLKVVEVPKRYKLVAFKKVKKDKPLKIKFVTLSVRYI